MISASTSASDADGLNIQDAHRLREEAAYKCGLYASPSSMTVSSRSGWRPLLREHIKPYVDEHYWLPLYSMGSLAIQREEQLGFRSTADNQGRLGNLR